MASVALIGNPNSGKTKLFNALTGSSQKVGNWPGVTVSCHEGHFIIRNEEFKVYDLPGLYSLNLTGQEQALDEQIAIQFLLNRKVDVIVNVIDAIQLERHLYLTLQLIETGIPVVIVLNRVDVANKKGQFIDFKKIQALLRCTVFDGSNLTQSNIQLFKELFTKKIIPGGISLSYPLVIINACTYLKHACHTLQAYPFKNSAMLLLEGQEDLEQTLTHQEKNILFKLKQDITKNSKEDADILIADTRYGYILHLMDQLKTSFTLKESRKKSSWNPDQLLLHRFLGIPFFLIIMYLLFFFVLHIGGAFQDAFDIIGEVLFIDLPFSLLKQWETSNILIAFVAHGIGTGLNTLISFIPVLAVMFFLISFLENCGYMSRAAFVMDRFMNVLGLPGKSFIPFLVGFGCNVPGILAARTLENPRDRLLTILMIPFMSCSARLAIYAVFAAAFFKVNGQNIIFSLYIFGIIVAVFTGLILRKFWLRGEPAPLVMELPEYCFPPIKELLTHTWQNLYSFIRRASLTVILTCMMISGLNSVNKFGELSTYHSDSLLAHIGQTLTPLLSPLGITSENWPASVALLTGIIAKEVVIGTLNTLYSASYVITSHAIDFLSTFHKAWESIVKHLIGLPETLIHPALSFNSADDNFSQMYGQLHQYFQGTMGAFAYLLFILLYSPCISTLVAIARELNVKLAIFSLLWSLLLAYGSAVVFYQLSIHFSWGWGDWRKVSICLAVIALFIIILRYISPIIVNLSLKQRFLKVYSSLIHLKE